MAKSGTKADIIIVGAGLIGMLTAKMLAEKGLQISLIEQGYVGKESSWAGGGIISPLYPWRYHESVNQLAHWSQSHYASLMQQLKENTDCDPQYLTSGLLYLDLHQQASSVENWMKQHDYSFVSRQNGQLTAIESELNSRFEKGWLVEGIAQIRNPRLVRSLRQYIERQPNIEILEQTRVVKLLIEHQTIKGVRSQDDKYYAQQVIIAGGAWSADILQGIQLLPKISPVKGQMIVFKAKPGLIQHIVMNEGKYVIPRQDGRVVCGSTLEFSEFDKSTDQQTKAELQQSAYDLIPRLKDYPIEKHWAGLRPGSVDGIPFIGPHPQINNLFLNAGHFRNGVVIGYASCQLLVNLLLDESPIVNPAPFLLDANRLSEDKYQLNLAECR